MICWPLSPKRTSESTPSCPTIYIYIYIKQKQNRSFFWKTKTNGPSHKHPKQSLTFRTKLPKHIRQIFKTNPFWAPRGPRITSKYASRCEDQSCFILIEIGHDGASFVVILLFDKNMTKQRPYFCWPDCQLFFSARLSPISSEFRLNTYFLIKKASRTNKNLGNVRARRRDRNGNKILVMT